MKSERIIVVGGLNQDLVMRLPRRPSQGETIRGQSFGIFPGGKGNNQAIAAARAGGTVSLLGRVGNDAFGDMLLQTLQSDHVDASLIIKDAHQGTGVAMIFLSEDGDNIIGIDPRANGLLSVADVERAESAIASSRILLMQLEVPLDTVVAAAELAKRHGTLVMLNPAPAPEDGSLPAELLHHVDLIVANETEAKLLTGIDPADRPGAIEAGRALRDLGPRQVIITLGDSGALVIDDAAEPVFLPTYAVEAIDTTAAGDAFCGALAAAIARGSMLPEAVRVGCAAGALATTVLGAVPSLPQARQISGLMMTGQLRESRYAKSR